MANDFINFILNSSKSGSSASKNPVRKKNQKIVRTAQETIKYEVAYDNGVLQIEPGVFTQSFLFDDISFRTKSDEEQDKIYEAYMRFLNSIPEGIDIYFSFCNLKDSNNSVTKSILSSQKDDEFDIYRNEMNEIISSKLNVINNNIISKKIMTIRVQADSEEKAMKALNDNFNECKKAFNKILDTPIQPISLSERLELLYLILNGSEQQNFWFEHDIDGKTNVDFKKMSKNGLTTKDIISPETFQIKAKNICINDSRYAETFYLDKTQSWMNTNFLPELCNVNFESITTFHIEAIPQGVASKMVHNAVIQISGEVSNRISSSIKNGGTGYVPAELQNEQDQINRIQEDIMNRDQRLFYLTLTTTVFAPSQETLKEYSRVITGIGDKFSCNINVLINQQERGFTTCLPLGHNLIYEPRLQTTESLGIFLPFDEIKQFDKGGFYYGVNPINKSLIIYNRLKAQNYNGLVLGTSGSGKSFSAKREMISAILNTNADVYIIDPDGEYTPLATNFNGSIIKIAPGNGVYINPFDLDIDNTYDTAFNPISMKVDFICGILETMLGGNARLTPSQKSIVDRCIQQIYRPYLEHLQELPPDENGKIRTKDIDYCPTMQNLLDALISQPNPEAQNLALVMEIYTTGNFDTFAHRTNVDLDNRLIVYDIKDVGSNLKELALKVCLNDIWNKMIENRRLKKWTWCYVDEFHLLLSNQSTAEFVKTIWKRARKFWGVPTGITQDVEDLLKSEEARPILNNSSFVYMLNQSMMGRNMLTSLLNLTESDQNYITNADQGCGIIYTGKQVIPFVDEFPENTSLYKIMSTKAGE